MAKYMNSSKSWVNGYIRTIESADLGSFAVILGLILIMIVFQLANPNFLTPLNLTNLMAQIAGIGILSVGVILVLLIGEIDLSVGAVSGATAAIMAVLVTIYRWNGILSILIAILAGLIIGTIQGYFVAKAHVPSFIVTLAGLLVWQGVQLLVLGETGTINLRDPFVISVANALIPPWLGWLIGILTVGFIVFTIYRGRRIRTAAGLPVQPLSIVISRIALISIAILLGVFFMNINRNQLPGGDPIQGIPTSVFIFIVFVIIFYIVTKYTKFGRHIFLVGGNAEAARRASIDVDRVRILVFALCSGIAACGGIVFASRLIAVNYGSGGGSILLNAIAAAVIGGTSLFGGRGSTWAALLGAMVIGSINNGMDL